MTMDALTRHVKAVVRQECADMGQMSLGAFIDALKAAPQDRYISFRFARLEVSHFGSFRGHYDHLMIVPSDSGLSVVRDVLAKAQECMGQTFTGYKGGEFLMDEDTPLWVATYGNSSDTRVVGLTVRDHDVIIETVDQDD